MKREGYQAVLCTVSGRSEAKDEKSGAIKYSVSYSTPQGKEGKFEADQESYALMRIDGCYLVFFVLENVEQPTTIIQHVIPGESLALLTAAMEIASVLGTEEKFALKRLVEEIEAATPQRSLDLAVSAPSAAPAVRKPASGFEDMDDDIPF